MSGVLRRWKRLPNNVMGSCPGNIWKQDKDSLALVGANSAQGKEVATASPGDSSPATGVVRSRKKKKDNFIGEKCIEHRMYHFDHFKVHSLVALNDIHSVFHTITPVHLQNIFVFPN